MKPSDANSNGVETACTPPRQARACGLRHTALLTALVVFAGLGVLRLGYMLFLPLAMAILLSLVLRPLVRRLHRWRLPYPLSALLLVMLVAGAMGSAVYGLQEPALQWLEEAPYSLRQLQYRILELREPIENVQEATEQMERLGTAVGGEERKVVVESQDLPGRLLSELREAAVGVGLTLVMLFFVLGWGARLYRGVVNALPGFGKRRMVVEIVQEIEDSVSRYLLTISAINTLLGGVVGVVLHLFGMPNPLLWGVLAGILNFISYLGPAVMAVILAFVALMSLPTLSGALVVPLVFLTITSIEGYVITPAAVGWRLTLNPLLIFVSLIFWFWIWGIIGALLTVPLLVCIKIVLEHLAGRQVAAILD